jgi:hypothetical protein
VSLPPTTRQAAIEHIRLELGAAIVCLVDSSTAMLLEVSPKDRRSASGDLDVIAVGCTDVVRSQQNLVAAMAGTADVEDIMVAVGDEFHVYHPLHDNSGLFVWAVVDGDRHNLALTRRLMQRLSESLLTPAHPSMVAS